MASWTPEQGAGTQSGNTQGADNFARMPSQGNQNASEQTYSQDSIPDMPPTSSPLYAVWYYTYYMPGHQTQENGGRGTQNAAKYPHASEETSPQAYSHAQTYSGLQTYPDSDPRLTPQHCPAAREDPAAQADPRTAQATGGDSEDEYISLNTLWYEARADPHKVRPTEAEIEEYIIDRRESDGLDSMTTGPECKICDFKLTFRALMNGHCDVCYNGI